MVLVAYIKHEVERAGGQKNVVAKCYSCLLSTALCCLQCCARILEFINKHAYIQVILINLSDCLTGLRFLSSSFRRIFYYLQESWCTFHANSNRRNIQFVWEIIYFNCYNSCWVLDYN